MRVAIVNDLAIARELLRRAVATEPAYSVAWTAKDGDEAVHAAAMDPPDVVLMDLLMPVMDGVEATRRIMRRSPRPILVVTASVAENFGLVCQALGAGALDAVDTPRFGRAGEVVGGGPLLSRLGRIRAARMGVAVPSAPPVSPASDGLPPVVALGASTGGPDALARVLGRLPARFRASVVIAQHIAAEFAPSLAEWLSARSPIPVRPARDGDRLLPGLATLAATDDHLSLGEDHRLHYTATPRDYPFRPSIDVLFHSLAARGPRQGVGVILTGMGSDGADGLLRLRQAGWQTIAQDEESSVVFGMPRASLANSGAVEVLPVDEIGSRIVTVVGTFRS